MTTDNGSMAVIQALKGEGKLAIRDPQEAIGAIMDRILSATTVDQVFEIAGTLGADDMLNTPFKLDKVEFAESTFEDGPPVYAIMTATRVDDGSEFVLTCGGSNVVTQLASAARFGEIPFALVLERNVKPTANGFYPLWLKKA